MQQNIYVYLRYLLITATGPISKTLQGLNQILV